MKKIRFRAEPELLEQARLVAESKGKTLEEEVRQWLKDYGEGRWKSSKHVEVGEKPRRSPKEKA